MDKMNVSPAEMERCLKNVNYPADKMTLKDVAQKECGDNQKVMNAIDDLPDWEYNNPTDVSRGMGEME